VNSLRTSLMIDCLRVSCVVVRVEKRSYERRNLFRIARREKVEVHLEQIGRADRNEAKECFEARRGLRFRSVSMG
jgi:hypothetical protein